MQARAADIERTGLRGLPSKVCDLEPELAGHRRRDAVRRGDGVGPHGHGNGEMKGIQGPQGVRPHLVKEVLWPPGSAYPQRA